MLRPVHDGKLSVMGRRELMKVGGGLRDGAKFGAALGYVDAGLMESLLSSDSSSTVYKLEIKNQGLQESLGAFSKFGGATKFPQINL